MAWNWKNIGSGIPKEIDNAIKDFVSKRKNPCLNLCSSHISKNTFYNVRNKLKDFHPKKLDVILTTPWWQWDAAYMIAKLLRMSCDELNIFVPYRAKSAWTFIALAANNICLWKAWELWPLDVQITEIDDNWRMTHKSALEEFKALENIKKHTIQTLDETNMLISNATKLNIKDIIQLSNDFTWNTSWKLYEKVDIKKLWLYARALDEWRQYWIRILARFWGKREDEAQKIISWLVQWYPSHWFVIDDLEWKFLWLPIIDWNEVEEEMDFLNFCFRNFLNILIQQTQQTQQIFDFCELYEYNWKTE